MFSEACFNKNTLSNNWVVWVTGEDFDIVEMNKMSEDK